MAVDGFIRLTVGGKAAGSEVWSFGITTTPGEAETASDLTGWLSSVATDITTWAATSTGFSAVNSTDVQINSLKANVYLAGQQSPAFGGEYTFGTAIVGSQTNMNPLQCALVVSLLTGLSGRTNRGRCYLPLTGLAFTSTNMANHQMASATVTAMATGFAALLTSINTHAINGGDTKVGINTPTRPSSMPLVTSVAVDSIVDTQRRRRAKLVPAYVGAHSVS